MESSKTPNPDAENEESPPTKKPATRDLDSDAYKLYLAEKYSIKRNDAFEKLVCDDKLFDSIDIALAHAHRLENLELQAQQQQKLEREIQARKSAVEEQAANEGLQKAVNESLPFVALIGAVLIAVIFWAAQQEKLERANQAEAARISEAKREAEAKRLVELEMERTAEQLRKQALTVPTVDSR